MNVMKFQRIRRVEKMQENKVITPSSLYNEIKNELDYSLIYARDRVSQLRDILNIDDYVTILSSERFISQQVKTKSDKLSDESGTMTSHLERLADYILFCKFDDEDNKRELDEISEQIKEADRVSKEKSKELRYIKKQMKPHRRIESSSRGSYAEVSVTVPQEMNWMYGSIEGSQPSIIYSRKDKELNQKGLFKNNERYWKHYAQTGKNFKSMFYEGEEPYGKFCYETLKSLEKDIRKTELLLESLEEGSDRAKIVKSNLSAVRGNYRAASEELRKPTVLSMTQVLNISPLEDLYEEIDYSNEKIVRILLTNYYRIKSESEKRVGTMFWCIAHDMERKVEEVRMHITPLQSRILDELTKKEYIRADNIADNIEWNYGISITPRSIYSHINKIAERISML